MDTMEKSVLERKFTVQSEPKINIIESQSKKKEKSWTFVVVVKWVSTLFMFSATLFCLVASKLSLVSISQRLNDDNATDNPVAFVMLILIMMIPQFLAFLRSLARSAFSSKEYWPSKTAVFWGLLGAIFEVAGVSMFVLVVIPKTKNTAMSIGLMNGIFAIPIMLHIYAECANKNRRVNIYDKSESYVSLKRSDSGGSDADDENPNYLRTFISFAVSLLLAAGGFAMTVYEYKKTSRFDDIELPITFFTSMVCLSFGWSAKFFQMQTKPSLKSMDNVTSEETEERDSPLTAKLRFKTARGKATAIASLFKLFLYPLVSFLIWYVINYRPNKNPGKTFVDGFKNFQHPPMMSLFFTQITTSLLACILSLLACSMNLQKICFVIPLFLSTPVAVALSFKCKAIGVVCIYSSNDYPYWPVIVVCGLFWLSEMLSLGAQAFKSQSFLMAKEEFLFWLPAYDGCFTEQYLLLNRKNEIVDEGYVNYQEIVTESHIYICTTMYHEADYEMEQLLQSLSLIDQARRQSGRQFEAHIFFDDGARGEVVKLYALQLLSLIKDTMNIDPKKAFKLETPYGIQMKWALPHGMPFVLHLKDKMKVKAKKRWSQVMYMSYVLDFKQDQNHDDLTYILATDADVKFTPADVMALMDLMSRNPDVGAVCGRTHPLGSGAMVWYQIFDYAIGHWLLKAANHVYGSVLCSPGCFSVYRAKAIRDVLPLYSSSVDCAMDFLMKDMGEDRWFCTLMVEAGWKLEYCATAENSTYCPDNFDEFFKQRRRWGPSTFANSVVVIKEQMKLRNNNDAISLFFIFYQLVLMISSIIGPSTVLLIVAGGLQYAYPYSVNLVVVLVLLLIATVIFAIICLFCTQNTQLKVAKVFTFAFAVIMSIVAVGLALQTVDDIHNYIYPPLKAFSTAAPHINQTTTTPIPEYDQRNYIFTPATWYLLSLCGIFISTAILHGTEGWQLIHGIWYFLCLPSGFVLLTIYSVANLTDRSWGTREGKSQSQSSGSSSSKKFWNYFKHICWCCVPPHLRHNVINTDVKEVQPDDSMTDDEVDGEVAERSGTVTPSDYESENEVPGTSMNQQTQNPRDSPLPIKSVLKKEPLRRYGSKEQLDGRPKRHTNDFRFPGEERGVTFSRNLPRLHSATPVEEWIPKEYMCYVKNFKEHGYDNVAFITGSIKEKDLVRMGIENRGHRKKLMAAIELLPPEDLFQEVPENVEEWLINLGLDEYWPRFFANSYTEPQDLADLKYMTQDAIAALFNMRKEAHLKRLKMATSVLQYPTKAQMRVRETRKAVMSEPTLNLKINNHDDGVEWDFWENLRQICLLPEQAAFNQSGELVEKLGDLRDTALLVLTIANVLWLTFMIALMQQTRLDVLGTSPASLAFLVVYSVVLILQFISMLRHRIETAVHYIARAPFKPGRLTSNWAWRDEDLPPPPDQAVLDEIRRKRRKRSSESISQNRRVHYDEFMESGLGQPLLKEKNEEFA